MAKQYATISLVFATLLLQLIILFLPTQLGLHFWPAFSRAAGIRVDYLSPTLYFTDLLIISYLVLSFPLLTKWLSKHFKPIVLFFLFISLNTLLSLNPLNTLVWWLRLVVYLLLFLTFRLRKISWAQTKIPLLISTFVVVLLEILQLYFQSSLGGIFYWLGERHFTLSTPGLARLTIPDRVIIRPPSVFSHPNSLAGYLLIVYYLLDRFKSPRWQKVLVFLGLILTFSKAALLAFVLVLFCGAQPFALTVGSVLLSFLQLLIPLLPNAPQYVSDRQFLLNWIPFSPMSSLLTGLGLGGFIPALAQTLPGSFLLPEKLQPLHNLPVLIFLENGLIGLALFIGYVKSNWSKIRQPVILGLLALVFITGAFDHYWLTLPQNKLILLLALSLLL